MNPMASMGRPTGGMPSLGAAPMSQAPTPQMGGTAPSTGNVMQITSTLRGMSDQQLQQYAAMHKSDPLCFRWPSKKAKHASKCVLDKPLRWLDKSLLL